jgi:cytochrome c
VKRAAVMTLIICLAGSISIAEADPAERGKSIFDKRGCAACHDPTEDQSVLGLGPSIEQIAEAYEGREDDVVRFLRGEGTPIVDEPRFSIMHGEIIRTRDLSDSQLKALGEYITEHHTEK